MTRLSKRQRISREKFDSLQQYSFREAFNLLKDKVPSSSKFIESIDIAINLGIDARKADQIVRGTVVLPHGTGRYPRVAVFTQGKNVELAKQAGADLVGMKDLADKIKKGERNFNIVLATPDAMPIVSQLGTILGPRGLMPNPQTGTVTNNIKEAINTAHSGQIRYRNDKNGIIHAPIGKINFSYLDLKENLEYLLDTLRKSKPSNTKGVFFHKITLSTTMGVGIIIDMTSLNFSFN
ncbi:MAG: 50S ribosomal protein L1 [Candidatus Dasytiphilus stammeri]